MTAPVEPARALGERIARIAQALDGGDDAATRTQVAAELEQLRQVLARTELPRPVGPAGPAGAVGPAGPAGGDDRSTPTGIDLAQLADAVRLLAGWLREPTSANEAQAQRAISELQASVGPLIGWDPAREDAARRQQYRQEARSALDDYLRDRSRKP